MTSTRVPPFARIRAAVLAALAPALLGGCATMFTGTTDQMSFQANVPGVRVSIDGQYLGETPLSLTMSRNFVGGRRFLARFEKEGFVSQEFELHREFNPVAVLDVSSPLTSGGIDVLTGSLMRFSPRDYHVQMLPQGTAVESTEFRRSREVYRFVLASVRDVQKDLARGGGPHLDALAFLLAGDRPEAADRLAAASLRATPVLLRADGGHAFVAGLNGILAEDPELRTFGL